MVRKNMLLGIGYKHSEVYDSVLPGCEHGSCGLNFIGSTVQLKSYATIVGEYDSCKGTIWCSGTYSATTRKHIGIFAKYLNNYYGTNLTYYDFKKAAGEC